MADLWIIVLDQAADHIQEIHVMILFILTGAAERRFFRKTIKPWL